ncbi:flagellin [Anaeromicropila herbilytica]|uniref:Flagellin n=1 Tax=Anaeromicropila herbilytica TaxID=2785025 RepID=A0A7R7IEP9_9FIRM|nr:flagellin [Anaeromicropila herbilytica]BCN32857.1 flagellin [Anaeromicropila herbilytica]
MSASNISSNLTKTYEQLSSMKKLNRAADNAAGLVISEALKSQSNGYSAGYNNIQSGKDLLNVADGGLSSIQDNLQRIRELSVKASNGTYSYDDKQAMQDEIDQLKSGIQDAAKGTEYNTKKLLDGSMADMNLAMNPDGTGMKIQLDNSTLESLGIKDFSVMGKFDISDIDEAIKKVSTSRSKIGATTSRLEYASNNNTNTSLNLTGAVSNIEDLDVGKSVSDMQKEKVLEEYRMFAQSAKMKQEVSNVNKLLGITQ